MTKFEAIKAEADFILENFDFQEVHSIMTKCGWKYYDRIPSVIELEQVARDCINDAVEHKKGGFCSTGGFTAIYRKIKRKNRRYVSIDLFWGIDTVDMKDSLYREYEKR